MIPTNQLCTFFLDKQMYGVDVMSVQEVIRYQEMTEVPLAPESIVGLINLRGQIVTAIDLRRRLGLPRRPDGILPMNVVVQNEEGAISLLVDQIGDVQEMNNDLFEPPPETLSSARDLIRGTYKMRDRLLLLLDTQRAIQVAGSPDS